MIHSPGQLPAIIEVHRDDVPPDAWEEIGAFIVSRGARIVSAQSPESEPEPPDIVVDANEYCDYAESMGLTRSAAMNSFNRLAIIMVGQLHDQEKYRSLPQLVFRTAPPYILEQVSWPQGAINHLSMRSLIAFADHFQAQLDAAAPGAETQRVYEGFDEQKIAFWIAMANDYRDQLRALEETGADSEL
jgi:hypothetical protein